MRNIGKLHLYLLALLAVQIVLALALASTTWRQPAAATGPLLTLDEKQIDRILIEGPDKARVELLRKEGRWAVPDAADFPADAAQVTRLIERLARLNAGSPVTMGTDAHERFRVTDTGFERRIVLGHDGKVTTLLLGSALGGRQAYARKSDTPEVYAIDLRSSDIPVKPDEWIDKRALAVPLDEISHIETGKLRLERTTPQSAEAAAPAWKAEGLAAGEELDPGAADRLARLLADLRFDRLDTPAGKEVADNAAPVELHLVVTLKDQRQIDFRLFAPHHGSDDRILKVSNRPGTFHLTPYQAQALTEAAAHRSLTRKPGSGNSPEPRK